MEGEKIIETREFSSAVDSDWALAESKKVMAAPTFFLGSDRLVGAQSYEALEKLITNHVVKHLNGQNSPGDNNIS